MRVDAEPGEIVEPLANALQVADAVAVRVLEGARIDLVDDAVLPPGLGWHWVPRFDDEGATPDGRTVREFRRVIGGSKAPAPRPCGTRAPCKVAVSRARTTACRRRDSNEAEAAALSGRSRGHGRRRRVPRLGAEAPPRRGRHRGRRRACLDGRAGRLFQRLRARNRARRPLPLPSRRRRDALSRSGVPLPARGTARALGGRRSRRVPRGRTRAGAASTLAGQVIYEMHVGTFTRDGTWAAAAERAALAQGHRHHADRDDAGRRFPGPLRLGLRRRRPVRADPPLRPPGRFARASSIAAHALGIGVILDVVYNHFGPDGNYLACFSDGYFTDALRERVGRRDQFRRAGRRAGARILHRQRRLLDRRVPLRRAAPRRHAGDP